MPLYTGNDTKGNFKSLDMNTVKPNGLVSHLQNKGKRCFLVLAELTELPN